MHTSTASNPNAMKAEPQVALPGGRLIAGILAIAALIAGAWWVSVSIVASWGIDEIRAGMFGIGLVAAVALFGVLLIHPQKQRECGVWMLYWLGMTVFRMLLTPVVAFLLYSALSPALNTRAFALAIGLTYVATVLAEAVIVSQHLKKSFPA